MSEPSIWDPWPPQADCEAPGHRRGDGGCVPDQKGTHLIAVLHRTNYCNLPLPAFVAGITKPQLVLICAGHAAWYRSNAAAMITCGSCGWTAEYGRHCAVIGELRTLIGAWKP